MKIDVPLKPPEYKRNALGQFDRPGKTLSKTSKPNKQMGVIADEVEVKRSPGRPKGSATKSLSRSKRRSCKLVRMLEARED